jgi:hypothetical protein
LSSFDRTDLAGEIALVRTLAEEGRHAPLVNGALYAIWGGVIAIASLLEYLRALGAAPESGVLGFLMRYMWLIAIAGGWVLSFAMGGRADRKPGASTMGNRTANAVWLGVGIFVTLLWIANALSPILPGAEHRAGRSISMFPVVFGVYGVAFLATASAARLPWMRGVAVASWMFCFASYCFMGSATQLLIGAAGSIVVALLPGIALMRREPPVSD